MTAIKHVIQFSGGIGSWGTARRVADQHGTDNLVLLFADVLVEDEDLYRFNRDVERDIGVPITVVSDGRTPQQAMRDARFVGNSRVAPCSHLLKQEPCRKWINENTDSESTILYVGVDWSEMHRLPAIRRNWSPWRVEAPLCDPPYVDKRGLIQTARARGVIEPRLYALGFPHNNCGGVCVRAGVAQWAHALRTFPDRYESWERFEDEMRTTLGSDVSILRDRTAGTTTPLPLSTLRQHIEARDESQPAFDMDDWGGCGCMVEVAP
jgi:hypothetical protein